MAHWADGNMGTIFYLNVAAVELYWVKAFKNCCDSLTWNVAHLFAGSSADSPTASVDWSKFGKMKKRSTNYLKYLLRRLFWIWFTFSLISLYYTSIDVLKGVFAVMPNFWFLKWTVSLYWMQRNATGQIPDSKPMSCSISDPTSNGRATSDTKYKLICNSRSVASIIDSFKGLVHPKMKILSLVTHPHVVPNL